MIDVEIKNGALYYGRTHRRQEVAFDGRLRCKTEEAAQRAHALIESGATPRAEYSKKCKKCSLMELCMPKARREASKYLVKAIGEI